MLSGELTVEQRIAVLNRFRDGLERILITTNVMARGQSSVTFYIIFMNKLKIYRGKYLYRNICTGIDVEQVTLVVNYDLPLDVNRRPDCETYLVCYLSLSFCSVESRVVLFLTTFFFVAPDWTYGTIWKAGTSYKSCR